MSALSLEQFTAHLEQATLQAGYAIEKRDKAVLFITLDNGPFRCDLNQLYKVYQQNPSRLDDVAQVHLKALGTTRVARPPTREETARALLPILQTTRWLRDVSKKAIPPLNRPFLNGLQIAYVFDFPTHRAYANTQMLASILEEGEKGQDALFLYALENLRQRTSRTDYAVHKTGDEKLVVCDKKDGYAATRVLLSDLMERWAKQFPDNRMYLGTPNRDFLVAFSPSNPKYVAAMSKQIRRDAKARTRPLTPELFLWEDGVLKGYDKSFKGAIS